MLTTQHSAIQLYQQLCTARRPCSVGWSLFGVQLLLSLLQITASVKVWSTICACKHIVVALSPRLPTRFICHIDKTMCIMPPSCSQNTNQDSMFTRGQIHLNKTMFTLRLDLKYHTDDVQLGKNVYTRLNPPGVRFTLYV